MTAHLSLLDTLARGVSHTMPLCYYAYGGLLLTYVNEARACNDPGGLQSVPEPCRYNDQGKRSLYHHLYLQPAGKTQMLLR